MGNILPKEMVTVNGTGLVVPSVICNDSYVTAFIDGGLSNHTYFLTYDAQTSFGGSFIQNMVLAVTGKGEVKRENYSYLAFADKIKPPDKKPPLNALKINDRYLLNDSGFFMGI